MTTTPHALTAETLAARRHRFAAFLIDGLICSMALLPVYLIREDVEVTGESSLVGYLNPYAGIPDWPIEVAITGLLAAYFWVQHALWGQTPGKRLCRLKVVSAATGESPDLRRAGVRALVHPVMTSVPYVGLPLIVVDTLWMFVDPKRRCLHDVIAGTVVVDLGGSGGKGSGGSGFLLGLGIVIALFAALVLVSVLVAL